MSKKKKSKAEIIFNSCETDKYKLQKMKEHFYKCADFTDENQTEYNVEQFGNQLKEILDYIVVLGSKIGLKEILKDE